MKNLLLSIVLLLFFQIVTIAQPSVWDGSADIWTKGDGTQESPYLIENAQQFAFVAEMVNGGVTTYSGVYFKLVTDIDLNNKAWTPIGISETKCFSGKFDGGKHSIFNLYINKNNNTNGNVVGLWGYIKDADIKHISVYGKITFDVTIDAAGGVVGCCESSRISNINSDVSITTFQRKVCIGGVCGKVIAQNSKSSFLINNINCGNLRGSNNIGGIVGKGGIYTTIVNSLNTGNIVYDSPESSSYGYAGGISSGGGDIYNCGNLGDVKYEVDNPSKLPDYSSCGISPGPNNVENCYNSGYIGKCYRSAPLYLSSTSGIRKNNYYLGEKTETSMKSASFPIILNADSTVFIQDIIPNVNQGFPIIKNTSYLVLQNAENIGATIATLKGILYNYGDVEDVYFEYKTSTTNYIAQKGNITGYELVCPISGLKEATTYTYRFYVVVNGERYYSRTKTFKTSSCSSENTISATICEDEEYNFNGDIITEKGTYTKTLLSKGGCDSVVTLYLDVKPKYTINKDDSICEGEEYDFYGTKLNKSGTYTNYVSESDRCIYVTLNLTVNPSYSIDKHETILEGEEYDFCGTKLTKSGSYTKVLQTTTGCDSIIHLELIVGESRIISVKSNVDTLGSVSGGGKFGIGESIILSATPESYATFVSWNDGNTENPRTILVEENVMYIAQFSLSTYAVNVSCDESKGEVSGGGEYQHGTVTVLTATPKNGYDFQKWSDGVTDNIRSYSVTNDLSVSAIFTPKVYTVQISSENENIGSVWGGGTIAFNESTTIYASPISNYRFVMWSDGNKDNPRTITVTDNVSLVALFELIPEVVEMYEVVINTEDMTKGSVSGVTSGEFGEGATIAFYATANDGYEFVSWNDGVTDNPRIVSVTQNIFLSAVFRVIPEPTDIFNIQITSADASKGTVSGITSGTIKEGTTIVFYATANEGYEFEGWSDGNTENPRSVTINGDIELVATFNQPKYYSITAISVDNKLGAVVGNGIFRENSVISIVAVPEKGCQFVKWNDDNTDNPREINVTEDIILIATFESNPKTDIPSNLESKTIITVANKQILVNGEAPAFVVTVAGQKIANANLKAGVYFVVVDGETVGVSVR